MHDSRIFQMSSLSRVIEDKLHDTDYFFFVKSGEITVLLAL